MIEVSILTPNGLYKKTSASIINVVSEDGQRGILPRHMPIVVALIPSQMSMEESDGREIYAVSGGTLYMHDDQCTILTPAIENVRDIDKNRAEEAKKRAQERIQAKAEDLDMARAQASLARALNRIKVVERTSVR